MESDSEYEAQIVFLPVSDTCVCIDTQRETKGAL